MIKMKFSSILFFCCVGLSSFSPHKKFIDKYDYVVAQDGSGDFTTIQAAIDASKAFPYQRVKIFIKNGVYHEKVLVPSCNTKLSLIGESEDSTVITYNDYFDKIARGRNSTFYTATLQIEANDFHAENLTIENSAGAVGQALALAVEGDRCSFSKCKLLGNQDTLYVAGENARQYFSDCYIEGTTDFIFGEATAVFTNCIIKAKANSFLTAASTPKDAHYGFVFKECKLLAAPGVEKVYLGRPWRKYAKTVYINCYMGSFILPLGWDNWKDPENEKTAFYAEYKSTGAGATPGKRVSWSKQLTNKEASTYTLENIFSLDNLKFSSTADWLREIKDRESELPSN
jgi:pectinesterase